MSFHNETEVQHTRRQRKCDWCWWMIEKGDPSVATSGICEGDFYTGRYHPECWEAIGRWCKLHRNWEGELPEDRMNRGGVLPAGDDEGGAQ